MFINDFAVMYTHYMQNDIAECFIGSVPVPEPIGSADMDFYVAAPHLSIDFNTGTKEIRPAVAVQCSGRNDLQFFSADCLQCPSCKWMLLPQLKNLLFSPSHTQTYFTPLLLSKL